MGKHHDFNKRIKALIAKETEMLKKETQLTKDSAATEDRITKQHNRFLDQSKAMDEFQMRIEIIRRGNDQIKQLIQEKEQRQQHVDECNKKMQDDIKELTNAKKVHRRQNLKEINNARILKEATGVFINPHTSPGLLQGVTVCEKSSSTQLVPLCIAATEYTNQEVQDMIWTKSQSKSTYSSEWKELFLSNFRCDPMLTDVLGKHS